MRFKMVVSSSFAAALLCGAVCAQEAAPRQSTLPPQSGVNQSVNKQDGSKQAMHASVTPQQIATCLALDNQEEVVLAKFAGEKSKNEEVVKFAKLIAEEHQACLKKLSKMAPDAAREGYLQDNRTDDRSESTTRSDVSTGTTSPNATQPANRGDTKSSTSSGTQTGSVDMMQLQREIAQQCITDSKQYLSKKEGAEFDKCFVGMQIAKHAAMHTKLVVLKRHTSDELQQIVSEGIQTTAQHMKMAESLMAKLDDGDDTKTSTTKRDK